MWPARIERTNPLRSLCALTLFCTCPTAAVAADGDDTLRHYLSKAEIVLAGEIVSKPQRTVKGAGVVHYRFSFKVASAPKGKAGLGQEVPARTPRRLRRFPHPALLRRCRIRVHAGRP